jgi:hypothetical protein
VDVKFHVFLTQALDGGEWEDSRLGHFILGVKDLGTPWKGGWMGTREGLDAVAKKKNSHHCTCWDLNTGLQPVHRHLFVHQGVFFYSTF